jgi:hypothetical protein
MHKGDPPETGWIRVSCRRHSRHMVKVGMDIVVFKRSVTGTANVL